MKSYLALIPILLLQAVNLFCADPAIPAEELSAAKKGKYKEGAIGVVRNEDFHGRNILISKDTVSFIDQSTNALVKVDISRVYKVAIKGDNHPYLGCFIGAVGGYLISDLFLFDRFQFKKPTDGILPILVIGASATIGGTIGANLYSYRTVYENEYLRKKQDKFYSYESSDEFGLNIPRQTLLKISIPLD